MKNVHRLACLSIRLEDSPNGGIVVHHKSNSALVVEVNSKKHLYPLLMDMKESILGKINNALS